MNTIYGESPEIQVEDSYNQNGGVALFSANEDGDTVSGGSGNDGEYPTSTRIRWTVTRTADDSPDGYSYVGGITGNNGWYTDDPNSPFYGVVDDEDIAEAAFRDGDLNFYFNAWNEDQSIDGQVKRATFAVTAASLGCATIIGG